MVKTPNGGHLYYKWPGKTVRCSEGAVAPGIDVRGDGGYIVGAGSLHECGERYESLDDLFEAELPVFPPELQELNEGRRRTAGAVTAACARIPEGTRNTMLFKLACRHRGQGMSGRALETKLLEENATRCDPPKDDPYVRKLARRVEAAYGPNLEFSDVENGRLFVAQHAGHVIYVRGQSGQSRGAGSWYVFDGARWVLNGDEAVNLAKATTDALREVALEERDDGRRGRLLHAIKSVRSAPRIRGMLEMAQGEPGISRSADNLDSDGWLLNCPNGTVDLRTGELRPHDPNDLITMITGAAYNPGALCRRWLAFLDLALAGDPKLIQYVQNAIGSTLVGDASRRPAFFLWGLGFNGKTTFLNVISEVLGEYAAAAHTSLFVRKRAGDETELNPQLVRLRGRRLVVASETDSKAHLSEAALKLLTGGGKVSVRGLYENPTEFTPAFKIMFDTNILPDVGGTEKALRDRIVIIPFQVNLEARLREQGQTEKKEYSSELLREAEGILSWAAEGCLRWQREGKILKAPAAVRNLTKNYWKEQDRVGQFLKESCVDEPGARTKPSEIYSAYSSWSKDRGEAPLNIGHLKLKLAEKGYRRVTVQGQDYWKDLKKRPSTWAGYPPRDY